MSEEKEKIYIDELYNNYTSSSNILYINDNIQRKLQTAIDSKKNGPLIKDENLIKYFVENKDIIFNDISKFNNFKELINEYTSYIYYYVFFFIFIVFIILHYIYLELNNQLYSYLLISLLVIYTIILVYNNYSNYIN